MSFVNIDKSVSDILFQKLCINLLHRVWYGYVPAKSSLTVYYYHNHHFWRCCWQNSTKTDAVILKSIQRLYFAFFFR